MSGSEAHALFGGLYAWGLQDVTDDPGVLDGAGRWAVAIDFEGSAILARFRNWSRKPPAAPAWHGVSGPWRSSLDQDAYCQRVEAVREQIARGWVYQANLCRVLSADCSATGLAGLFAKLQHTDPGAGGLLHLPDHGISIASASPEVFLRRRGPVIASSPIKGTASARDGFLDKDRAENIMIVDLVRNDLSRVAVPGSVTVDTLLKTVPYRDLFHLVSTVSARLVAECTWPEVFRATFPPGSVTGAPKTAALEVIAALEPVPRQYYCGAFGVVDADAGTADLAVAIRTFWLAAGQVHFGTGAGITWGSDPLGEWRETQLKAQRLLQCAEADA